MARHSEEICEIGSEIQAVQRDHSLASLYRGNPVPVARGIEATDPARVVLKRTRADVHRLNGTVMTEARPIVSAHRAKR
jgi:hypothetical protein